MAQNTSSAVMQQRKEPHDSLDYFPTPPWAARALVEHVLIGGGWGRHNFPDMTCWEPACGEGHLKRGLDNYFKENWASDVHDYGTDGALLHDFLFGERPRPMKRVKVDFIITNPPFQLAAEFIEKGLEEATQGVAMLVRTSFIEGIERYNTLFSVRKPALLAPFAERVIMARGILRDPDVKYWDEETQKWKRPSTATSYCWLVWAHKPAVSGETRVRWIPPCRMSLTRAGDYAETGR